MANIKKYTVDYNCGEGSITVEIDHNIMTEEALHEINNFWSEAEDRLADADGNILNAVLTSLCEVVLRGLCADNLNIHGVILSFDWENSYFYDNAHEGWPKMDGSMGIKIIDFEPICFCAGDFRIKEVA
ncbi:DUF2528 family protein [uncultured Desulfuromusa sp.]|uniref:DUF2528 family protein n=1 Tax=uncultured Desulfuromusa sp. TaxID=219183 RepID=UPI002AA7D7DE|nr:DUF2528 family protein [uncultured Desulfuromusa sp.]